MRLDAAAGDRPKITVADGAAAVAEEIYRFFGEASSAVSA